MRSTLPPPTLSWRSFWPHLREVAQLQSFRRREYLYSPSDQATALYLLLEGQVRLFRHSTRGRALTLGVIKPGDWIGEQALFPERCHGSYAQALTNGWLFVIPRRCLGTLLEKSPGLVTLIIENMGQRIQEMERRMGDLVFKSVPQRLATLLLDLLDPQATQGRGPAYLPHRYTHQQIADLLNSHRETVTRAFGRFRDDRVLDFDQRRIVVLDVRRLREMALR